MAIIPIEPIKKLKFFLNFFIQLKLIEYMIVVINRRYLELVVVNEKNLPDSYYLAKLRHIVS